MSHVVDSWTWIEILSGGQLNAKAKRAIAGKALLTTTANIYEVRNYLKRNSPSDWEVKLRSVIAQCNAILPIDLQTAELASEIKISAKNDIGAVDCFSIAAAKLNGARLVTGDPHFKGFPGVEFIS